MGEEFSMIWFEAFTMVDITNSKESKIFNSQYKQQQNLNTLVNTISLRSQPIDPKVIIKMAQSMDDYKFGRLYEGVHTVWCLSFSIEHSGVYDKYKKDDLYFLKNDSDGVAIINNLEETIDVNSNCFETLDARISNLYFNIYRD